MLRRSGIRVALGLLRWSARLSRTRRQRLAAPLGAAARRIFPKRLAVARRNIELCFPDLDAEAQHELVNAHFRALGAGLLDLGLAWHASDDVIRSEGTIHGLENIRKVTATGRGVLLVCAHFTSLDLGCRLLGTELGYAGVWRAFGDPLIDAAARHGRERSVDPLIEKTAFRQALRILKGGGVLFMAADQADTTQSAISAPFFGIPALTLSSPLRLANAGAAELVPMYGYRNGDGKFHLTIGKPVENFAHMDAVTAATRLNHVFEMQAKACPEQYYWVHRRFKNNENDPYDC